jgi:hypothetical protein
MPSRAVTGILAFTLACAAGPVPRAAQQRPGAAQPGAAQAAAPAAGASKPAPEATKPAPAAKKAPAAAKPAPGDDRIAALRATLQRNAAALHGYEWVETTVVSVQGEERSRGEHRCRYGDDGKVQRDQSAAVPKVTGKATRGPVVAGQTQEISAAMKEAVGLVLQYVPLDPARIQAARDAGHVKVKPADGKGLAHIVVDDYLKAGDSVAIDLDTAASRLSGLAVSTFTDKEKHKVTITVDMATLPDGTAYASNAHLDVKEQGLSVALTTSGHKKTALPD